MTERRAFDAMERHIQTILISIVTGSIVFAANYFYTDNQAKAVQRTQLEVLTTQVIELRADIRAMQNSYVKREEFADHETRLRQLEKKGPHQ